MLKKDYLRDTKPEVIKSLIREMLAFDREVYDDLRDYEYNLFEKDEVKLRNSKYKEHKRFEMSGYGETAATCSIHNNNILRLFVDWGLYSQIEFIYVDAYKGNITLHYKEWGSDDYKCVEDEYGGWGTVDILYDIIQRVVVNNSASYRRID